MRLLYFLVHFLCILWVHHFGTLLVHGAVLQSIALMGRLGGRLGGIWGYAAVCAITGQGGIILGRYYTAVYTLQYIQGIILGRYLGSQCMGVDATCSLQQTPTSSWEKESVSRGEHLINKVTQGIIYVLQEQTKLELSLITVNMLSR